MHKVKLYKVERMTYIVITMWIFMGLVAVCLEKPFDTLAVYFVSLSGFAAAYVFSEMKRPSKAPTVFMKGPSSSREKMMYWVLLIWFFIGIIGLTQGLNMTQLASYFAALTPFVSAYVIGHTFKPDLDPLTKAGTDEPEEDEDKCDDPDLELTADKNQVKLSVKNLEN